MLSRQKMELLSWLIKKENLPFEITGIIVPDQFVIDLETDRESFKIFGYTPKDLELEFTRENNVRFIFEIKKED
jgi:hypothetical protein